MEITEASGPHIGTSDRRIWRRRKRERPEEIRKAALEEFARKGFAGTRMSDIAQRAGVTKGTLYLYFRNKLELFNSVGFGDFVTTDRNLKGENQWAEG